MDYVYSGVTEKTKVADGQEIDNRMKRQWRVNQLTNDEINRSSVSIHVRLNCPMHGVLCVDLIYFDLFIRLTSNVPTT